MKTYLKIAIIITVTFACFNNAGAYTSYNSIIIDNVEYEINNDGKTARVVKVSESYSGGLAFPETIDYKGNTYPVTEIGKKACKNCKYLTKIILPETIEKIGRQAFSGCEKLHSCELPDKIKEINYLAFSHCNITKVDFPPSLTLLYSDAYAYCPIRSIFIPKTLSFKESIELEEKWEDSGLVSLDIHGSPFYGCSELGTIVVEEGHPIYDSRFDCNAIIETATNKIIHGCYNTIIPDGVEEIGCHSFGQCSKLIEITFPSSVMKIDYRAFMDCENLKTVHFNEGLREIECGVFCGCINIKSIHIPSSLTSIDEADGGIPYPYKIESITVDKGNPIYDSRDNCNAIIETATNTLIRGCFNTLIPDNVTSINYNAFYCCTGLKSIIIPNKVQSIGSGAFQYCSGLTSLTIPSSVTSIGDYAFRDCTGLTSVTFGKGLKDIREYAFRNCSSLTSITIPEGVKRISNRAFEDCNNIATLYLHIREEDFNDGDVKIESGAFPSSSLSTIYCFSETPFNISAAAFNNKSITLYVPIGSSDLYKEAPGWKDFLSSNNRWIKRTVEEFDVTGIENIKTLSYPQEIYSLDGIKMPYAKKGVNIINGKKVYVK